MYSITYGDDLLYDPLDRDAYPVYDVSLSAEINGSGSCEFSITKTHPLYDVIDLYDTNRLVTVTEDSHILFKGYVSSVDEDEYGVRTYSCTGILSFLKKSVVRPYSTDAEDEKHVKAPSTIDGFFNWLISEHNNHTDRRKRFIVGRNEGDIVWNENVIHVSRDSASTTADVLQSELLDGLGGYIFVRYGDDGVTYLDYLSECRDTNAQVIDFGVNLVSYSRTDDATDVATVCYARGGTPEKDEGSDKEKPPVDLTKYPDGPFARGSYRFEKRGDRIICLDLVDKYGYSEMTFEDSNILDPYALLASASIALLKQLEPKITIDIRAIDLSLFMDGYKPMRCGELVRVRSDPNGFDSYMLVSSMDLDLENPENTEYTLGTTFDAFTGESNKIIRQLNAAINKSVDKVASLDQTTKDQAIQIGKVEDVANDASNKADTANTTANQAQSTANTANATATEAKNTADTANTTATDAKTTADSANKAADAAQSSANKAQGDVDKLKIDIPETYATKSSLTQTAESITANVESVKATANSAVTAASNAQQTADAVTLNLSKNYQTKAQNDAVYATQTSLKATSDSLSANITANAKTAQSAVDKATSLEANLNGFKTTVAETYTTKDDFNDLTIGGRNLLLNSNFSKGTDNWVLELQNSGKGTVEAQSLSGFAFATTMLTINVTNNTSGFCRIYQLRSPNPMRTDTVDTVSFWATASESVPVQFGRNDDNRFITVQKGWHYYKATVPKWNGSNAFIIGFKNGFIGTLKITNIMWEHASKASQWSPAPEDLQPAGDYSTKSYVDQTAESVALGVVQNYKGADGSGLATKSDITVATDSITTTVSNTYQTKADMSNYATQSQLTQTNNKVTIAFQNSQSVGGRNLLLKTGVPTVVTGSEGPNQNVAAYELAAGSLANLPVGMYHLQFKIKSDTAGGTAYPQWNTTPWNISNTNKMNIGTEEQTYSTDYYVSNNNYPNVTKIVVRLDNAKGNVTIRDMKLERGNSMTPWTSAPEDTMNDLTSAVQKQAADIASKVSNDDYTGYVDATNKNLNDIQSSQQYLSDSISNEIALRESYIQFGQDESNPYMDMGNSSSPNKMRLTNTKLSFTSNNTEVASVSNDKMRISNAEVLQSFRIGNFVWQPRSDGHMALKYSPEV